MAENLIVMNVRVPQELRDKVAFLGRQDARTLSQMVRFILKKYVTNHKEKLNPKAEGTNV